MDQIIILHSYLIIRSVLLIMDFIPDYNIQSFNDRCMNSYTPLETQECKHKKTKCE
jgi:hypothetical protein